jgi:hypothetical protein
MILLLALATSYLPPLSRQYARTAKHRKTEKEEQLADGRGRERGGREA